MTTLFVPLQDWTGKSSNHLKFQFHLDKLGKEMINVSMHLSISMATCSLIIKCTTMEDVTIEHAVSIILLMPTKHSAGFHLLQMHMLRKLQSIRLN